MVWLWMLGCYALGATLLVFVLFRRQSREDPWREKLGDVDLSDEKPVDRIKLVTEMARLRKEETRWFEKALSAMGVVAFFSMLIATGVQTLKAGVESSRAEALRAEVRQLEEQRENLDSLLEPISASILEAHEPGRLIDSTREKILRLRLQQLAEVDSLDTEHQREQLAVAVVLREPAVVYRLLEEHPELKEQATPDYILYLAEHFYVSGTHSLARAQVKEVLEVRSSLTPASRVRCLVLAAALEVTPMDELARELAPIWKVSQAEAKDRLDFSAGMLRRELEESRQRL